MIFGHQADSSTSDEARAAMDDSVVPQMTPPNDLPATNDDLSSGSSVVDQPGGMPDLTQPTVDSTALSDESSTPPSAPITQDAPQDTPAQDAPAPPAPSPTDSTAPTGSDDLLGLKQQALDQLAPLVDHLDQSPEEKFRTTMMMIQSTDNQSLLKEAYELAQAIPDEKVKAQALLDVVNEINYFTQKSQEG